MSSRGCHSLPSPINHFHQQPFHPRASLDVSALSALTQQIPAFILPTPSAGQMRSRASPTPRNITPFSVFPVSSGPLESSASSQLSLHLRFFLCPSLAKPLHAHGFIYNLSRADFPVQAIYECPVPHQQHYPEAHCLNQ